MRKRPQRREREDIVELFGDVIVDGPSQLYGDDGPGSKAPPAAAADDDAASPPAVQTARPAARSAAGPPPESGAARAVGPGPDDRRATRTGAGFLANEATGSGPAPAPRDNDATGDSTGNGGSGRRIQLERAGPSAPAGRGEAKLVFADDRGLLSGIAIWQGLATILTLGFFRFWMKTAQRSAVWSHTLIGEEPFEYTGRGVELFVGAMIAVIFVGATLAATNLTLMFLGMTASFGDDFSRTLVIAAIALTPLAQYAIYRARRYRLTRTRWRGLRLGMDGSGLGLVARWALWTPLVIASAGLLWPFWRVARERYLTNHSFWGDERFRFEGGAWRLMPVWGAMWLIVAGSAALLAMPQMRDATQAIGAWLEDIDLLSMLALLVGGALFMAMAMVAYLAGEMRLFMNARRIAGVTPHCVFGADSLAQAYLKTFLKSLWPGAGIYALIAIVVAIPYLAATAVEGESHGDPGLVGGEAADLFFEGLRTWRGQSLLLMSFAVNYMLTTIFGMWLWLAVYFRTLHGNLCAATSFTGLDTLDEVRQRARDDSMDADGFSDALDLGGL